MNNRGNRPGFLLKQSLKLVSMGSDVIVSGSMSWSCLVTRTACSALIKSKFMNCSTSRVRQPLQVNSGVKLLFTTRYSRSIL